MDDRLTELEVKIAFQEDLLQQLNEVIVGQQRAIDRLEKRFEELRGVMLDLDLTVRGPPPNERPPHY